MLNIGLLNLIKYITLTFFFPFIYICIVCGCACILSYSHIPRKANGGHKTPWLSWFWFFLCSKWTPGLESYFQAWQWIPSPAELTWWAVKRWCWFCSQWFTVGNGSVFTQSSLQFLSCLIKIAVILSEVFFT